MFNNVDVKDSKVSMIEENVLYSSGLMYSFVEKGVVECLGIVLNE